MTGISRPVTRSAEEQTLSELKKIAKILTLANGPALERELNKYMTTKERKKIWINIDGKRVSSQIAKDIGVTTRAVEILVKTLTEASLVEPRQHGEPPRRSIDYVPIAWLESISSKSEEIQVPLEVVEPVPESTKELTTGETTNG